MSNARRHGPDRSAPQTDPAPPPLWHPLEPFTQFGGRPALDYIAQPLSGGTTNRGQSHLGWVLVHTEFGPHLARW